MRSHAVRSETMWSASIINADFAGRGGDEEGRLVERLLFADEAQFAQASRYPVALVNPPGAYK
jgi:hypothetical protein